MSAGAGDSDIEKLARALWGEPNRQKSTRDDIRYGTNGSKSVRPKDRTWYDHESNEGGGFVDLYQKAYGEVPSPSASGETAYDYRSPDGALLYQVVRRIPKDFRQRRPDGNGGWVWKMAGVVRVPYRLPELMGADPAVPVFICEGEKDCDALAARGFVTTTNPGGAGKWLPNMSAYLRGRDAIILPDNDQAGDDHALDVAAKLHGIARTVTIHRLPGLPVKGDVSDWLATGGNSDDLTRIVIQQTVPSAQEEPAFDDAPPPSSEDDYGSTNVIPITSAKRPAVTRNEDTSVLQRITIQPINAAYIEPRQWAYGRFLLFGSAAVIGAVDGHGKGLIAVTMMLSMITGRQLLGEQVWRQGPVVIVSYEDDITEWHRRIAAACIQYEIDQEDILPHIHFITRPGSKITFGALNDRGNVVFPDSLEIVQHIQDVGAVMLLIDPFNHAHSLEDGNSNVMIAKVAGEVSRICQETRVAGLVLHHLRKGGTGSADDLMGAVSLRATFRACRILARMTPEIAEKMNITDPWRYVRIGGSKENYAPPPEKSSWFRLVSVSLQNRTDDYPDGDEIGVATSWKARGSFEGMDYDQLSAVFEELRALIHGPSKNAKHTPWAGIPLMQKGGRNEREAGAIVKVWIENGVLSKGTYYHTESRHEVSKVDLDDDRAQEILKEIRDVDVPDE